MIKLSFFAYLFVSLNYRSSIINGRRNSAHFFILLQSCFHSFSRYIVFFVRSLTPNVSAATAWIAVAFSFLQQDTHRHSQGAGRVNGWIAEDRVPFNRRRVAQLGKLLRSMLYLPSNTYLYSLSNGHDTLYLALVAMNGYFFHGNYGGSRYYLLFPLALRTQRVH